MDSPLPPEVLNLIAHCLESFDQVEVLLLLAQGEERAWSAQEATRELRHSHDAKTQLEGLVAVGLAERVESQGQTRYRYSAPNADARNAVTLLKEMYETRPVTLIRAVYERPSKAVRSFADSFRFRGTEK